jgi:hypothetical protein
VLNAQGLKNFIFCQFTIIWLHFLQKH